MNWVSHSLNLLHITQSPRHNRVFHQTLKNMIRAYFFEYQADGVQGIHILLLQSGKLSRIPGGSAHLSLCLAILLERALKLLKENWLASEPLTNLLDQVSDCVRLISACELAQKNMKVIQSKMKKWYHKKARRWTFKVGEKVLALLPLPNHSL